MKANKTQKIPKVINLLQKKYSCVTVKSKITIVELAIYYILNQAETKKATDKSLNALREEFVDWNEVRVTHPREIEEVLKGNVKNSYDKSVQIVELLGQIFFTFNTLNLEFLLEEEFVEVKKLLQKINTEHQILPTILLHVATHSQLAVTQQTCVRVGKRIGLWNETTPSSLKKNMNKATEKYLPQFNTYFYLYGEEVCLPSGYDCKACILAKECAFGQKRLEKSSPATSKKRKTEVNKKVSSRSRQKSSKK